MLGELAARKFSPDSLPGDAEEHEYQLAVDPGVDDLEERQVLSFIDYPGGWISDGQHEERVRAHLADSPAVIVPIDATLIMESRPSHMADVARLLEMDAVKSHVRKWAKTRRREGDSTLLVLAPIKCETYFDDNGGRSDRSAVLLDHVRSLYHEVVDVYRKEAGEEAPLLTPPSTRSGLSPQWLTLNGSRMRSLAWCE